MTRHTYTDTTPGNPVGIDVTIDDSPVARIIHPPAPDNPATWAAGIRRDDRTPAQRRQAADQARAELEATTDLIYTATVVSLEPGDAHAWWPGTDTWQAVDRGTELTVEVRLSHTDRDTYRRIIDNPDELRQVYTGEQTVGTMTVRPYGGMIPAVCEGHHHARVAQTLVPVEGIHAWRAVQRATELAEVERAQVDAQARTAQATADMCTCQVCGTVTAYLLTSGTSRPYGRLCDPCHLLAEQQVWAGELMPDGKTTRAEAIRTYLRGIG